jgi:hypothetical protein
MLGRTSMISADAQSVPSAMPSFTSAASCVELLGAH